MVMVATTTDVHRLRRPFRVVQTLRRNPGSIGEDRPYGSASEHKRTDRRPCMTEDERPGVVGGRGLERIADFCVVGISRTGVDAMSVTFANAFSGLEVLFATDALADRVAQLEFTLGEGPAVDAFTSLLPSMADDLDTEVSAHRWPFFAAEAV